MSNPLQRSIFFDERIKNSNIQNAMKGEGETFFEEMLHILGYKENEDYEKQFPLEELFVADFSFPNEQILIEIDGKDHKKKKKIEEDMKRDRFLRAKGWITIRIPVEELKKNALYWKYLVRDFVEEGRSK